jgi:hypothetical protein
MISYRLPEPFDKEFSPIKVTTVLMGKSSLPNFMTYDELNRTYSIMPMTNDDAGRY